MIGIMMREDNYQGMTGKATLISVVMELASSFVMILKKTESNTTIYHVLHTDDDTFVNTFLREH